ncbi:signal peptide peptidase-like 1 isoform X2 [Phalaenopsis equestris]|uniref:signal peptide peptidase-like 1 isoform X2 n=1 Tax=Phalaenopsis equestris TaxID=78828 RepID=UPI0009E291F6|nr:signal peptide peptidase-like 1 isoform X2 [Phalaenopsis equestris]
MESIWKLSHLLEPTSLTLIVTAVFVTFAAASRALDHGKEMERNLDFSEASITLDRSQALMIPLASSCSLLIMFYLFSSVSHLVTIFTAVASASALFFCLSPYVAYFKNRLGLMDPFVSRCCSKSFTRSQGILLLICIGTVICWLISGHWLLNNILGICICIAFVSHVRLPNVKICSLLLVCLFVYDIFWVFFSERFFGANVMVSVATQKASNPVHTVANSLSLPGLQLITKKLELPVKLIFPRNLLGGVVPGHNSLDYMMLGLGDMAIPGMLMALVLCFDHRKSKESSVDSASRGHKYVWYAVSGYAVGLVAALAAGILSQSPQPALLYLK